MPDGQAAPRSPNGATTVARPQPGPLAHRRGGDRTPAHTGGTHAGWSPAADAPARTLCVRAHDPRPQPSGGAALTAGGGPAHAPWAQDLADQLGLTRLSPPARSPPADPCPGARLWLGAGGDRLRENLPGAGHWVGRRRGRVSL